MNKKLRIVLAGFAAMGCLVAVVGCKEPAKKQGKVLATFNGMSITESEFRNKVNSLPRQLRRVAMENKRDFLEDLASEHFLLKEAERQKIEDQEDVRDLLDAAHRKIVIAKLVQTEIDEKVRVGEDEARRYYDAHRDEFMTPPVVRASHILVKTEEEAKALYEQLSAGADFEDLARAKSLDGTAIRGGDLGFLQRGQSAPEFEEAVFALEKGKVGAPAKSRFGWHVIKVTDKIEPRLRDFASVKSALSERLTNEKRSAAFKEYVKRLKGNIQLKVDEQALEAVGAAS